MLSYRCCGRTFPSTWRDIPWRWISLTVQKHEEHLHTHSLTLCKYHHIKCIKPHLASGMLLSFLRDWQGSGHVNTKRTLQSSFSSVLCLQSTPLIFLHPLHISLILPLTPVKAVSPQVGQNISTSIHHCPYSCNTHHTVGYTVQLPWNL